ncbi:hypothetical protein DSLASN_28050 [Desulfoluna limicola]|uniref:Uncharacterized protein n=1 Tax=Desulfoluna limicola TaxID=2810562 RepID=A0ABM7PJ15_9BACT|nr:hypothetical protein [Desulfoluna limicola]BCS97173.1 hypothetical protein DSLASN_28050 [Desulfoluna limicola]
MTMIEKIKPSRLLDEGTSPRIKRAMGGIYRSRTALRLLMLLALVSALFGGVGLEVCLSEPMWEKHIWLPSLLIALAVWILVTALIHVLRMKLFGKLR